LAVVFDRPNFFYPCQFWLKERNVNKKRETIRKPVDHESTPEWDDQDRHLPPTQDKSGKHRSEEEDMILDKDDD
jgi:hypothetical protein